MIDQEMEKIFWLDKRGLMLSENTLRNKYSPCSCSKFTFGATLVHCPAHDSHYEKLRIEMEKIFFTLFHLFILATLVLCAIPRFF